MIERQLRKTTDGSDTLYVPAIDECYHSMNGAIRESEHIFINAGFRQCPNKEVNVLEIGFGTGLNAFLTLLEADFVQGTEKQGQQAASTESKKVNYTTIELFPVEIEYALHLNYPEQIDACKRPEFERLHTCAWNRQVKITDNFTLTKLQSDFTQAVFSEKYDVFYFDAFSPDKQPGMWNEEMFGKLYLCAAENAILTTYCAKGAVRRAMQAAGFVVERLPGPPGKREILRAARLSG